ncbi:Glutaredoxin 3 [Cichlidogyrus casuarinus]|uniref:Glutaredoxin 3 n=1 Tax=Cichlidogyrus casuarinus TaxID=1844966 RepID=A0ABD2PU41_9PLAT
MHNQLCSGMNQSCLFIFQTNAELLENFCKSHQVSSVPTIMLFKCNTLLKAVVGFKPADITTMVESYAGADPSRANGAPVEQKDLNERLKSLIHKKEVMLFMKGSPAEPRCGFSRTITGILNDHKIDYGYFDILSDEEVRQGLKTYSNWPTYPQLYHKGELLGGLDIVKEMQESGELKDLPKVD